MPFVHKFVPRQSLKQITQESGVRHYEVTETGERFPSVTTILSALDTKWLEDWKRRVGEEKANEIGSIARRRGTAVHLLAEKYVMNDPEWAKGSMPFNLIEFKKLKKILDEHVDEIYGIELPLFSRRLKTAGTTDQFCRYKGLKTVLDFKTSTREKKEEKIESYFIQTTAYADMIEELYGEKIEKIVILMIVDHSEPLIFEKDRHEYMDKVNEIFVKNRPL